MLIGKFDQIVVKKIDASSIRSGVDKELGISFVEDVGVVVEGISVVEANVIFQFRRQKHF